MQRDQYADKRAMSRTRASWRVTACPAATQNGSELRTQSLNSGYSNERRAGIDQECWPQ
jgi:hypothetical protein